MTATMRTTRFVARRELCTVSRVGPRVMIHCAAKTGSGIELEEINPVRHTGSPAPCGEPRPDKIHWRGSRYP